MRLVLASHNRGKVTEFQHLLQALVPTEKVANIEVLTAADIQAPDVQETGISFAENALLKARTIHQETGLAALADDSGLMVDVLGAAPGIFSARWSGKHGDDQANRELLLDQLQDIPSEHRGAKFICTVAYVAEGVELLEVGEWSGTVLTAPRGEHGFGYDPIFQPEGYQISAAQMEPEEKNAQSHRARALTKLIPRLPL